MPTSDRDGASLPPVELTWPGKTEVPAAGDEPPCLHLRERYPPPGQTAGAGGDEEVWRDLLVGGDNIALLRHLLDSPWRERIARAGGLRLVYLDPPFLTGQAQIAEIPVGDRETNGRRRVLSLPAFEDGGRRDLPAYLSEMRERLVLIRDLLADDGSLYLHCDHRLNAYLRLLLDEVFGPDRFVNEIVWHYGLGNPGGSRAFARKHDTILLYARTDRYRFNRLRGEVTRAMANKYRHEDEHGRYMLAYGRRYRLKGGKPFDSVWEIPSLAATDRERLSYPTQKPEALLARIVQTSSDPGDLVADLCCGCGTLPAVAIRHNRRWLAADRSWLAVRLTRARLLALAAQRAAAGHPWRGMDLVTLDAWTPDPAPLRVALTARTETTATAAGPVVRLTGLAVEAPATDLEEIAASLPPGRATLAVAGGDLWRLARDRRGELSRHQLTTTWVDWLESWSVGRPLGSGDSGLEPGDAVSEPLLVEWHAIRERGGGLPLVSAPLAGDAAGKVIRITTLLGDEITHPIARAVTGG